MNFLSSPYEARLSKWASLQFPCFLLRKKNHLNGLWKNTFGGSYGFFGGFDWYEVLLGARWAKGLLVAIPYLA